MSVRTTISIPASMAKLISPKRLRERGFGNFSEYVRSLVREDLLRERERAARERLGTLITEALEDGRTLPLTPELISEVLAEPEGRDGKGKKPRKKAQQQNP
ncbi:MAG: hypothetical protein R3E12_02955 [Candidatus Eisenbacteria bacterium]